VVVKWVKWVEDSVGDGMGMESDSVVVGVSLASVVGGLSDIVEEDVVVVVVEVVEDEEEEEEEEEEVVVVAL